MKDNVLKYQQSLHLHQTKICHCAKSVADYIWYKIKQYVCDYCHTSDERQEFGNIVTLRFGNIVTLRFGKIVTLRQPFLLNRSIWNGEELVRALLGAPDRMFNDLELHIALNS